jgi:hypothetical protein
MEALLQAESDKIQVLNYFEVIFHIHNKRRIYRGKNIFFIQSVLNLTFFNNLKKEENLHNI